jgi:hypothetical protein
MENVDDGPGWDGIAVEIKKATPKSPCFEDSALRSFRAQDRAIFFPGRIINIS